MLVTVPLVRLAFLPVDGVALAQLAVCTLAVALAGVWGTSWPVLLTAVGLAATTGLLAWTAPARWPRPARPDPVLTVLAAVALVGALVYGWPLARNHTLPEDITNGVSHFPMQAAMGLAVAGVAGLAALTRTWLPAGTAGFTAVWLGVESVVYPDLVGSLGVVGGVLAVVWALVLVLGLARSRRHPDTSP